MILSEEPDFVVVGVVTRTDNDAERDPATARLPRLWERAYCHPWLSERRAETGAGLVAVLTDYDSDDAGAYTQVVGVRVESLTTAPEGLVAVAVPRQPRHHVPAHGTMPDALITAWQTIWQRTASGDIDRTYRTDYESHGPDGADIYLSVAGV